MATELTPIEIARNKLLALETALIDRNPQLPHLIKDVHTFLRDKPECVTLFTEEPEMAATLVKALERHTNIELVAPAKTKASSSKTKALGKASASDLGF